MRKAVAIAVMIAAAAVAVSADMALAQRMATGVTVAKPGWAEFQAAALDWLRATVLSWPFAFGTVAGVLLAEVGRLFWRWAMRTFGFLNSSLNFVLEHRLIAAALAVGLYWIVAQRLIA